MSERAGCVPNIGPDQRRHRLVGGAAMTVLTLALAGVLIIGGAPRAWRVALVLPAMAAALGVFQAREQTCVALAARGRRNLDRGDEAVADAAQLARHRVQSRRVYVRSALAALVTTTIALLWP